MSSPSFLKRMLRSILTVLAALLLMSLFYIAVIMGQPQDDPRPATPTADPSQPLLSPLPSAIHITADRDLPRILEAFPAPVLCASYGNALIFDQGLCSDISFEGGLARVVTLTYRTENGDALDVTSIYPARAMSLLPKGDLVITGEGPLLASLRSVQMVGETSIRFHAQGTEGLYAVTAPKTSSAVLRQLTASLQLAEGAVQ